MNNNIGRVLLALREIGGYTQVELAKKASLSQSYVCEIEAEDKEPSLKTLLRYAELFQISVSTLLYVIDTFYLESKARQKSKEKIVKEMERFEVMKSQYDDWQGCRYWAPEEQEGEE